MCLNNKPVRRDRRCNVARDLRITSNVVEPCGRVKSVAQRCRKCSLVDINAVPLVRDNFEQKGFFLGVAVPGNTA